jgi:hypothetical protein
MDDRGLLPPSPFEVGARSLVGRAGMLSDRRVDRPRPDQFSCCSTVIETLRSAVTPGPRKFPMNA